MYGAKEWVLLDPLKLFTLQAPFSFDSHSSVTCGRYALISIANKTLMSFLDISSRFKFSSVDVSKIWQSPPPQ
jgi:hypothetical protein